MAGASPLSSRSDTPSSPSVDESRRGLDPGSDRRFLAALILIGGTYVILLLAMVAADLFYTTPGHLWHALGSPEIRYAIRLSLLSCTLTTLLSLWVAVPIGYLMARFEFPGRAFLDALLDIPIVLPPLVIGLSLLILFQTAPLRALETVFPVTYAVPSVILAQFMVACAFAVRTLRTTFAQINPRQEQVAMTLGCNRAQAFWRVVLPAARPGILTAATLAWARALGEFGPILVFSGATRMKTEVLPTTVFLELSVGRLEAAVAVSLLMMGSAVVALLLVRAWGGAGLGGEPPFNTNDLPPSHHGSGRGFQLRDLSMEIPTGSHTALMGRTGSGKTTLLEGICGLRSIRSGSIWIGDREVTNLPPGQRGIGLVPQDGALFDHLTVRQHLEFALKCVAGFLSAAKAGPGTGRMAELDPAPGPVAGGDEWRRTPAGRLGAGLGLSSAGAMPR